MGFAVRQKKNDKSWTELLVEESERSLRERGARRKLTFRRMYSTVFTLFLTSIIVYSSLFYAGAFFDAGQIIGYSEKVRQDKIKAELARYNPEEKGSIFAPLIGAFKLNRIYLRKGQTIRASYALPRGSELELSIHHCKSLPVVEVFKCHFVGSQKRMVKNSTAGKVTFRVNESGFYYFKAKAIKKPDTKIRLHSDYKVLWQRGGTPKKLHLNNIDLNLR